MGLSKKEIKEFLADVKRREAEHDLVYRLARPFNAQSAERMLNEIIRKEIVRSFNEPVAFLDKFVTGEK